MNQRSKPISATKTESIHLSKLKLAAILTAVCATALAAVALASRSNAAVAIATQGKPTIVLVNGAWANNARNKSVAASARRIYSVGSRTNRI